MASSHSRNAAPVCTGHGASKALDWAINKTTARRFEYKELNPYPVNSQAARYVATRYYLPMPTAALVASLAGLGGVAR